MTSILLAPLVDLELDQQHVHATSSQLSQDGRLYCRLQDGYLQASLLQQLDDNKLCSVPITIALASDEAPVHAIALLNDDQTTSSSVRTTPPVRVPCSPPVSPPVSAQYIVAATAHSMCVHVLQLVTPVEESTQPLTCRLGIIGQITCDYLLMPLENYGFKMS